MRRELLARGDATIADTELLGLTKRVEDGYYKLASDSQGVILRLHNLRNRRDPR